MSCGCPQEEPVGMSGSTAIVLKKAPCGPCAQAAAAIASTIPEELGGTKKVVSGATDDLFTIQAFLQTLTTGVAPTPSALSQAQSAANSLSVSLAQRRSMMRPVSIGLMVVGALAVGGGVAYLLTSGSHR